MLPDDVSNRHGSVCAVVLRGNGIRLEKGFGYRKRIADYIYCVRRLTFSHLVYSSVDVHSKIVTSGFSLLFILMEWYHKLSFNLLECHKQLLEVQSPTGKVTS
jgi:hypothetical protein